MNDALAPVRRQLLQQATSYAEHVVAEADASAAQMGRAAVEETERLLGEARAQGEVDARDIIAAGHARARAKARHVVLAARRQVYDQLVHEVRSQARAMAASRPDLIAEAKKAIVRRQALGNAGVSGASSARPASRPPDT